MTGRERVPRAALAVLAALAAAASLGIAALAHAGAGFCDRRLFGGGQADTMPGMAMPPSGVCPVVLFAGVVALATCALAVVALLASRSRAGAVATSAAGIVLGLRTPRLAALLAIAGAIPLGGTLFADGSLRLDIGAAWAALLILAAGATLTSAAFAALSRAILSLTRRVVVALLTALRLVAIGDQTRWARPSRVGITATGTLLAKRRPSRAPPTPACSFML